MICNAPTVNLYKKKSQKSEVVSQMLYGEKFKILKKFNEWLKVKTYYDGYIGFIKNENYEDNYFPTHKISKLKSIIFTFKDNKFISCKKALPFGSRIKIISKKKYYVEFSKNEWIKKRDIKLMSHYIKPLKIFKLFLGTKYLWGGKSFEGIDCSALIQSYYFYNNIYCPRDSVDQINFFRNVSTFKNYDKDQLIFWKGHVAYIIDKKSLIHAFGPKKKVVIMKTNKTIFEIKKNSKLNIKAIKKINVI